MVKVAVSSMGFRWVVCAAGLSAMLLAGMVMVGWTAHDHRLIQLNPQFAPMQFNTALGFVLSGAGIVLMAWGWRAAAVVPLGLLLLLAAVTLSQYVFRTDFGIDRLFVDAELLARTSHAGRMSPFTGMGFLFISAALLLLCLFPKRKPALIISSILTFIHLVRVRNPNSGQSNSGLLGILGRNATELDGMEEWMYSIQTERGGRERCI